MSDGSVSFLLVDVKSGDPAACQRLWERYFEKVVHLARNRLGEVPRRAADEEDVALSAFDSFVRGAQQGRFPRLDDRSDLWRLLVVITTRKAANQINHEATQKRGGGRVVGEEAGAHEEEGLLALALSREPSPEMAAEMTSECHRLFGLLRKPEMCLLALLKMEGFTNEEAAEKLGCARATVQRMLQLIQEVWGRELRA